MPKTKKEFKPKLTEIARSFSWTVQVENFAPRNFFMSQKIECPAEEAEMWSERLFNFCRKCVEKEVENYKQEHLPADQKVITEEKALGVVELEKGIEL